MKRLSTNQKFKAMQSYILGCINDPDSNEPFGNDKEAVSWAYDRFQREYWGEGNKSYYNGNERKAFASWLQGLSCVRVAFMNYEIIELGKEFQLLRKNASEANEAAFIERWFGLMSGQFYTLKSKLNA